MKVHLEVCVCVFVCVCVCVCVLPLDLGDFWRPQDFFIQMSYRWTEEDVKG